MLMQRGGTKVLGKLTVPGRPTTVDSRYLEVEGTP